MGNIINTMKKYYRDIICLPEDSELGADANIHHSFTDELGNVISFTYTEEYIFLREALKVRKKTAEYMEAKKQLVADRAFIKSNRSKDDLLKEAQDRIAANSAIVGEAVPQAAAPATEASDATV